MHHAIALSLRVFGIEFIIDVDSGILNLVPNALFYDLTLVETGSIPSLLFKCTISSFPV